MKDIILRATHKNLKLILSNNLIIVHQLMNTHYLMSGRIKKLIEHAIDILVNIRGLESNSLFLAVVVLE